jgi:small subunit ribosomal protein S3
MGQKVHPIGFRIGVIRDADSTWYADKKQYKEMLKNDWEIRSFVRKKLGTGNISRVELERAANKVRVTLHTARPGAVIGRGGKGIDEMTMDLQKIVSKFDKESRVHVNVSEVRQPELDAQLVSENIAQQLERRISHRRAMRQAITRALRMNAKGIKMMVSGRLNGAEIARTESEKFGKIPLHTLRADIDYGFAQAHTTYGVIGVKVWIYKGEVLPDRLSMEPTSKSRARAKKAAETPAEPPAGGEQTEAATEVTANVDA